MKPRHRWKRGRMHEACWHNRNFNYRGDNRRRFLLHIQSKEIGQKVHRLSWQCNLWKVQWERKLLRWKLLTLYYMPKLRWRKQINKKTEQEKKGKWREPKSQTLLKVHINFDQWDIMMCFKYIFSLMRASESFVYISFQIHCEGKHTECGIISSHARFARPVPKTDKPVEDKHQVREEEQQTAQSQRWVKEISFGKEVSECFTEHGGNYQRIHDADSFENRHFKLKERAKEQKCSGTENQCCGNNNVKAVDLL